MNLSITSTADGRCRRITGVAASASSNVRELDRQDGLGFGSGTRLSLASSTTPSVPSEPTIILARLNGFRRIEELVEVVTAYATQNFREAALDFVGALRRASRRTVR